MTGSDTVILTRETCPQVQRASEDTPRVPRLLAELAPLLSALAVQLVIYTPAYYSTHWPGGAT